MGSVTDVRLSSQANIAKFSDFGCVWYSIRFIKTSLELNNIKIIDPSAAFEGVNQKNIYGSAINNSDDDLPF